MILEALEDAGVGVDAIADGLPVTLASLRNPRERVGWDVFAAMLERVERIARGVLTPEEIGERVVKVPSYELLRRAGRMLVSPRQLYELANRLVAPALFSNVLVALEWLPSGRLVVTAELLPGYAGSTTFFRLCHGNVAAATRVLDLPASIIEEQTITERSGRLVLLPPASHTLGVRLRRGLRALVSVPGTWRAISHQETELEESLAALRTSKHELQQLLERLPDGVLIHEHGGIRWANAALVELFGASRIEDVIGRHILDFAPPAEREALTRAMRGSASNEVDLAPREYRVFRGDGSIRHVESGVTQIVEYNGRKARLVVLRDVTEHHRLREQAAIRTASRRLARSRPASHTRSTTRSATRASTSRWRRATPPSRRRAARVARARPRGDRSRARHRARHEAPLARARRRAE